MSIFTVNSNEEAVPTRIDAELELSTDKSENSLNPEGWISDFTGSFHTLYGIFPFIEYENFW